ncbi:MAG: SDR family NAD(P)-dependent oxidoreductase [Acidimicrobiia bacterium]
MPDRTGELFHLPGAVAVITGATRGIGKQAALALGRAGARVVLVGRTREDAPNAVLPGTLDSVLAEMTEQGIEARVVQADLSDVAQTQSIVDATLGWYGRCDVLVNNAAYNSNGPLLTVPASRWEKAMRLQVVAPMQLVQGFVPGMLERGSGRVVNVSSAAAVSLASGLSLYAVSKRAMERLNDYLHLELGGKGVSFNAFRIEKNVTTEGMRHVLATQGEAVVAMGGTLDLISTEAVAEQLVWMVRRDARWSGHTVTCAQLARWMETEGT